MENDEIVDTLNDLIETCKDGEYGFNACFEHTSSQELRTVFTDRAAECRAGATELKALVTQYGGTPEDEGSATGALHRGWVAVRGVLAGSSDTAMLEECERGEDAALARYRNALSKPLPAPVRAVVERQLEGVRHNHDMIKALRDRAKSKPQRPSPSM